MSPAQATHTHTISDLHVVVGQGFHSTDHDHADQALELVSTGSRAIDGPVSAVAAGLPCRHDPRGMTTPRSRHRRTTASTPDFGR
jgi:hypothetical protein